MRYLWKWMTAVEEGKEHALTSAGAGAGVANSGYCHDEPRRKVSISNDAIQADAERQRKISSTSQRSQRSKLYNDWPHHLDIGHGTKDNLPAPPYSAHHINLDHLHKYAEKANVSWWYLLCTKCRQKETGPGWEPPFWQTVCPYPFCPTYRHIARCISLVLLVLLAWGVVFSVIGHDAAPGGQLFSMLVLVISAHFGGYLFRVVNLPGLIGMLAVGVLYQNIGLIDIHGPYVRFSAILRRVALVIILTRAGLDLDPGAMRRLFLTTLKIGLVPWVAEAGVITIASYYFLHLPLIWSLLTGSVVAAVSPAVIVPCLFRLRSKGYGVAKGIPTVVIAISGIDDAASVAAFGIVQALMFSTNSLLYNVALGPVSILGGIGFGAIWGLLAKYVPEKGDPFVVPMRILMLLGGGLIAIFGSEEVGLEGAGPLGVVAASFISSWVWSTQGWEIEDNPVATAFEIFWMIFEPILFSLTGTQIRIHEIAPELFYVGSGWIVAAALIRMIVTVFVSFGESFNSKEKAFFALGLMAKASVQAALAPVALDTVVRLGLLDSELRVYAETVMIMCILCIVLTAPVGAILITFLGPRLLTKTVPGPPEGWRTSARPSLRDITIIDEGKEEDDIERRPSHSHPQQPTPRAPRPPHPTVITQQP